MVEVMKLYEKIGIVISHNKLSRNPHFFSNYFSAELLINWINLKNPSFLFQADYSFKQPRFH